MRFFAVRLFGFSLLDVVSTHVPGLRHFQQNGSILLFHSLRETTAISRVLAIGFCLWHGRTSRLASRQVNAAMRNYVLRNIIVNVRTLGNQIANTKFDANPQGLTPGMPTREEYLRYAEECAALAQRAADSEARTRLLEMAQAWRDLADKADKHRSSSSDGGTAT
jgi:hypothetical protein